MLLSRYAHFTLCIEDAALAAGLPQQLVQLYGVRAYVGVPLRLRGEVAGSLCLLDTRPRRIGPEVQLLLRLAPKVDAWLEALAGVAPAVEADSQRALQRARLAATEAQSLSRLTHARVRGALSAEEFSRAQAALAVLNSATGKV